MHLGIVAQFGKEMSLDDYEPKKYISRLLEWNRSNSTNIAIPVVNFGTTGISSPCSSRALWTEKVARKLEIAIQSAASARWRPTLTSVF
jgi:hypothetical protein